MQQRTQSFLYTADENRAVAQRLLADTDLQPAARRWAMIVAFYAAVHLVNAYIWEQLRIEPTNHGERRTLVATESVLRPVHGEYLRLQRRGYDARYLPQFRPTSELASRLINSDLEQIHSVVTTTLANIDAKINDG